MPVDAIYVPGRRGKAVYMDSGREWFILVMVSTYGTMVEKRMFFEQFAQWFIWCRAVNPGEDD